MIETTKLDNGLVVIIEEVPHVKSLAYSLLIPGGVAGDDEGRQGESLVLAELTSRGAGNLDSRALSDYFDSRGIRHSESASLNKFSYQGALLADNLSDGIKLLAAMVLDPILPAKEIPSIQGLLLLDIQALEDNPARKAFVELTNRYYPSPYGRSALGQSEGIKACTLESLVDAWQERYHANGAILSIAGNAKAEDVLSEIHKYFPKWQSKETKLPPFGKLNPHKSFHIPQKTAQEQIVLAYPSATFLDEHYYAARLATGILSGGMFGRLFIEVREKHGLCYSVFAKHSATSDCGAIMAYAGTTPDRAEETLKVMRETLTNLAGTITEEELERAKANILSSVIIGEESTAARATSNASDWFYLQRLRTLDEIKDAIKAVSIKDIDNYLKAYPSDSFMLLTLGEKELSLNNSD